LPRFFFSAGSEGVTTNDETTVSAKNESDRAGVFVWHTWTSLVFSHGSTKDEDAADDAAAADDDDDDDDEHAAPTASVTFWKCQRPRVRARARATRTPAGSGSTRARASRACRQLPSFLLHVEAGLLPHHAQPVPREEVAHATLAWHDPAAALSKCRTR